MSARPFWVAFTICMIVLVEWLAVPKAIDYVITNEIVSMSMMVRDANKVVEARGLHLSTSLNPDDLLSKGLVNGFSTQAKLALIYSREPAKATSYIVGLIIVGILAGFLLASVLFRQLMKFGDKLREMTSTDKIAVLIGLVIGLIVSALLLPNLLPYISNAVGVLISAVLVYIAIWAMMSMRDELKFYFSGSNAAQAETNRDLQKPKLLDTNVIIDGRISDVCRAGFIEGQIIVPSFVLEELQHIADSSDSLRRARGRRGLDILNAMRKELDLTVRQCGAVDPEDSEEVDARLVKLAKEIDGSIVTNDFNLNKVAELQGVQVLNINELANALKPVVLPGEIMTVSVIKEGKEAGQGVAYLDDGTMIVVEAGKPHIGQTVEAVVTSVLQTVAGKMIFANLRAVQEEEDELIGRNVRSYSGVRPRKKVR